MATSLSDLFDTLRRHGEAAKAKRLNGKKRGKGRRAVQQRPSTISFETFEPRLLLSGDDVFNVAKNVYLDPNSAAYATFGSFLVGELDGALNIVDNVASAAKGVSDFTNYLNTSVPALLDRTAPFAKDYRAPTLEDILGKDNGALFNVPQIIADALNELSVVAGASPATIVNGLDGLTKTVGNFTLNVEVKDLDPNSSQKFLLQNVGGDNYEYLFSLEITVTGSDASDSYSLDLGRAADGLEIDYGADNPASNLPDIALSGAFKIETTLGIKATITEELYDANPDPLIFDIQPRTRVSTDGFFLRDPSFSQGVAADVATTAYTGLSFGFIDIGAKAGTAKFDLSVTAGFTGDFDDVGDLTNPSVTTGGSIDIQLPVEVNITADLSGDGFANSFTATPIIRIYSDNPFSAVHAPTGDPNDERTAPSIQLLQFEELNPFRNIDASSVADLVNGLGALFQQLQAKADLFGLKMPLLDTTKLSDALQFAGPLQTLYEKLTKIDAKGVRVADFVDVQGFVAKLKSALADILAEYNTGTVFDDIASLLAINPRYDFSDPGKPTLLFTIDLNAAPTGDPIALDGDLGLSLDPLGEVAVSGNLAIDSSFRVQFTLGIELIGAPEVGISSTLVGSSLVSLIRPDGSNPPSDGTIDGTEDVKFNLVLGGQGTVSVTLAHGNYGSADGLATALQTAITNAINAAVTAKELPSPAAQVRAFKNAEGRIVISSDTLPYLQIINRGAVGAFSQLGFADLQRASTSPLPANGVLSGEAAFWLTLGTAAPQEVKLQAATTQNNTSPLDLVADLNGVLNGLFGAPASGNPYVSLVGDEVVGYQLRFANGLGFVRIDGTNPIAQHELGLSDDAVSSALSIRGESYIEFGANSQANALPASGNLGNISFTVRLTEGGLDTGALTVNATVDKNDKIDEDPLQPLTPAQAALRAAADINAALAAVTIPGTTGQRLSSVLVAMPVEFLNANGTGTGKWGLKLIQPAATLSTGLKYAFADSIEIGGVDADDDLGWSNATTTRLGTSVTSQFNADAVFTLNLATSSGKVDQLVVTVAPTADTVQKVVDAINAAIAADAGAGGLAGKVVAGLDGASIVLAVVDPLSTPGIWLSSVNSVAKADLGLDEGMSGRKFEGLRAFITDVKLDAALQLSGEASGKANFGFVTLDLGTAAVDLDATIDVDFAPNVGDTNKVELAERLYLDDIFDALGRPLNDPNSIDLLELLDANNNGDLVGLGPTDDEEFDIRGSASVEWSGLGITVAGAGNVGDPNALANDLQSELDEATTPSIKITLADITNPAGVVVDAELGSLADLADFSFDDVIAALRAVADWLKSYVAELDIVNKDLPLLGVSLNEVLGFVEDFTKAVDDIANNPTKSLQELLDKVNEGLQRFAGPLAEIAYQANSPGVLTFNLKFQREFADTLPLEVDLVELLAGTGVTVPGLELAGAANLDAKFGIDAELVVGINVDAFAAVLDDPVHTAEDLLSNIFMVVEDDDDYNIDGYTHLELTGYAAAQNVTFIGSLGPLGLFVSNGGAVLNKSGTFGDTDAAFIGVSLPDVGDDDGLITLQDLVSGDYTDEIFNPANVQVELGVAATLPVSFPTASSYIGNFDFTARVTDPFGDGGIDYDVTSVPDFSKIDLGSLSLFDTLNLFIAGADTVLGTLGDLITGELFGEANIEDLPLVGDALDDAGAFIDRIRDEVIPRIQNALETGGEVAASIFTDIGEILQTALSSLGVLDPASAVKLELLDADGNATHTYSFNAPVVDANLGANILAARGFAFVLDLKVDETFAPSDVDLNLEVFELKITDPISVELDLDMTFGIGVSLDDGFFFRVNPDGEDDISGSLTIDLPETLKGRLFFLELTATNNNGADEPELAGAFAVDLVGTNNGNIGFGDITDLDFDVKFGAEVDLDFKLALGFAKAGYIDLPSISAQFDLAWGFGEDVNGIGIDALHPETPLLSLGDVRLDIGGFLKGSIAPFVLEVYDILEPIDPILDIITDPIPVVSDLIGPTSLLDLGAKFGVVDPALVTALETLDQLLDFAANLDGASGGEIKILPGTITLGGNSGLDLTDMNQVGSLIDPAQKIGEALNALAGSFGGSIPQGVTEALAFIQSGFQGPELDGVPGVGQDGGGFKIPFLDDYSQVLGLFFGRNMTVVNYDLPPLSFGFDLSIYVPIWGPLGARFTGGLNATIDLAFGYDTEGVRRFIDGGFNPLDLVQGFFVYDDGVEGSANEGIDIPELLLTGRITAAAELNAVIASAGVGGGIFASVGFDLADPNEDLRIRLDEILANLYNGFEQGVGPLGLFDVDALIEAKLFAYVEALFGVWKKEFQIGPSIPLYEEHYEVPRDPVLATDLENGTLRLNVGKFAGDRQYTNNDTDEPVDGDETIEIKIVSSTEIWVRGSGPDFNESGDDDWQVYKRDGGFTRILGFGELGVDVIKVIEDATAGAVYVELDGGAGNDTLQGGNANDLIYGAGGEDVLIGGAGNDTMDGSAGADCMDGGAGNDLMLGGAGDDIMQGGSEDDRMLGNDGNDILTGGTGADTILGGIGGDLIAGGADGDVLLGEEGPDRIWGDQEFSITNCALDLVAGSDEPLFLALGTEGKDWISGGGASDELLGDGNDDLIYGDSGFKLSDEYQVLIENGGPVLTMVGFGQAGNDNISGGAGNDTAFGEAGNDLIRGDNLRVDNENDGDPFTWVEGDRFSRGVDDGAADGNDTLYGGTDSDIIYGNGGNDTIAGGSENDILHGNAGNDRITGDFGADVIFGDSGIVEIFTSADDIDPGPAVMNYSAATQDFKRLRATAEAGDGDDWIDGGLDNDIIFGGAGLGLQVSDPDVGQTIEDRIEAGGGDDVAYGDQGEIKFTYVKAAGASFATLLTSVDKTAGGDDQVFGSTGRDVLVGGKGGDFVYGDGAYNADDLDSRDVVAGDHVVMTQQVLLVSVTPSTLVADTYVAAPATIESNEDAPNEGGDDTLDGRQDDDFLIGGPGDDDGTGGRGNDVILGDRGRIEFDLSGIDVTAAGFSFDRSDLFVLKQVKSTDLDPTVGMDGYSDIDYTGIDELSGGHGNDVVIGGGRGDFLYGDQELDGSRDEWITSQPADVRDILLGDNGQVDYAQLGKVAAVMTTDTVDATGGSDVISGDNGGDIALGGVFGDTIYGDDANASAGGADGDDILLGDNGLLEWLSNGRLDDVVGIDIEANNPELWAKYGTGVADTDISTLDLVTTKDPGVGGRDTVYGDNGRDMVFGGSDADKLYGDSGDDANSSADGRDILFGDHGRLYPQFSRVMVGDSLVASIIHSRNYFAIDTGAGKRGQGDEMWGEEGDDVLLGQQGDDRMWGGTGNDDMIGGHNVAGGLDELAGEIVATLKTPDNAMNDIMDGGAGDDAMAGDNAIVWRRGDDLSPRFRALTDIDGDGLTTDTPIYSTSATAITANIGTTWQSDPADAIGRDIELLDHSDDVEATPNGRFGQDVMAGGAGDDTMFGQLGDDLMQGDGSISAVDDGDAATVTRLISVTDSGAPTTAGDLYFNVPEATSDGDDYMEGNGGLDLMYGGLGQDDMIGGSSALFGLGGSETLRPDDSDTMFGGAGIDVVRNDIGDATVGSDGAIITTATGHARDADYMMGDNANVYRLVTGGADDAFLTFNYDNYGSLKLIPRAMQQLDYRLGGGDRNGGSYNADGQATVSGQADNGKADLMHGESGDDVMFGMTGSDVMFGEGQDDDMVGGYGHDWMSGGTGQDGMVGDDGLVFTSRNSSAFGESLYGINSLLASDPDPKYSNGNVLNEVISTPGTLQTATINRADELKKTIDLVPFSYDSGWSGADDEYPENTGDSPFADDIIFGGLGSDFLHGGSGDDAISGAEALLAAFVPTYAADGTPNGRFDLGYAAVGIANALVVNPTHQNPGNVLKYRSVDLDGAHLNNRFRAGEFALYDEYDPLRKIELTATGQLDKSGTGVEFLLNFAADEGVTRAGKAATTKDPGYPSVKDDGADAIFGDLGNDWIVGGTGRDNAYGGWGNDLINADDNLGTNGERNDQPDTAPTYEDRAYGGAGRDVLIGNTGGDRLIDWVGEYNSYLVPFAPFGMATVSRTLQPFLPEFLYALSAADGADPTQASYTGDPRRGEPSGELGLVLQKDQAWQDQTGAPADPQAGNIPGGKRDVLRSADFSTGAQGFVAESGSWRVASGRYEVSPLASSGTTDAVSLFNVDAALPTYFEITATINAVKPTAGFKANAYVIFDYVSPTNFKFAGINVSTNKFEIGQRTATGWQVLTSMNILLRQDTDYNLLVAVNGNSVTAVLNGSRSLSYAFTPRQDADGFTYAIRDGMVGIAGDNARARIDNVRVQIVPPAITYSSTDAFTGGTPQLVQPAASGWSLQNGRYVATPASGAPFTLATNDTRFSTYSMVKLDAIVRTGAMGGVVFDVYSPTDFKWAAVSVTTQQVLVGHYTARDGWVVDAAVARTLSGSTDYTLSVTLKGTTVSVLLNGQAALSRVYNSNVVDGATGLFARGGTASFDSFTLSSDDPRLASGTTAVAASTTSSATKTKTATATSVKLASSASAGGLTAKDSKLGWRIDWSRPVAQQGLAKVDRDATWQHSFVASLGQTVQRLPNDHFRIRM